MSKPLIRILPQHIHFRKTTPHYIPGDGDYYKLIEKVGIENNYIATPEEYMAFKSVLADFCIFFIVYNEKLAILKGCEFEIRICPYQLMSDGNLTILKDSEFKISTCPYQMSEKEQVLLDQLISEKEQVLQHKIRYDLYEDAWFGRRTIFSRQIDPENLLGLNETKRLEASFGDEHRFFLDYTRIRCEHLPEKGILEDLSQYRDEVQLVEGISICDYQIRLLYDDPYKHFKDLVSAFNFINQGIGKRFDFIVDPE